MNLTVDGPVIHEEFWQGSERLYIFFGGILGGMGMSPFELARSGGILDYSRIFIRDPYQAWYQRGLPEIGDSVYEIARHLQNRIAASGAEEVRFVGNCMGGYAAILMCSLLNTGRAIAFAPQSFVSPEKIQHFGDLRAPDKLAAMYQYRTGEHIYDLQLWLQQHSPEISADVYVCSTYEQDLAHARELSVLKNIRIHQCDKGGHRVVVHLHQLGRMPEILAA
jgi:hypothetical protein